MLALIPYQGNHFNQKLKLVLRPHDMLYTLTIIIFPLLSLVIGLSHAVVVKMIIHIFSLKGICMRGPDKVYNIYWGINH